MSSNQLISAKVSCVKWHDPTDEIANLVRFVAGMLASQRVEPRDIAFVAPNYNWAAQIKQACDVCKISATLCLPVMRMTDAELDAFAKLKAYAQGPAETAPKGMSLVHGLGLDKMSAFSHALLHTDGLEDAAALWRIVNEQIKHPTMPRLMETMPIMLTGALEGSYEMVVMAACVDGLLPSGTDAEALEQQRQAFIRALQAARKRLIISSFTRVDAAIATAAHIPAARYKTEHATKVAMVSPSRFLAELGAECPSTVGGQTFLREHNLN